MVAGGHQRGCGPLAAAVRAPEQAISPPVHSRGASSVAEARFCSGMAARVAVEVLLIVLVWRANVSGASHSLSTLLHDLHGDHFHQPLVPTP